MPIVLRAETDIFRLAHFSDFIVNPVNLLGSMGAGLSKEFSLKHPGLEEAYKDDCASGKLKVGTLTTFKDNVAKYTTINLATKRHFADPSEEEDIKRGVIALRKFLQEPKNESTVVTMPILGVGAKNADYEKALPIFQEYLGDLANVINVCMLPDKMKAIPKYLGVLGPKTFGESQEDRKVVVDGIYEALKRWELEFSDFSCMISGGDRGVESDACGISLEDPTYKTSVAFHAMKDKPPIIVPSNTKHHGTLARVFRDAVISDIATHLVVFRPENIPNVEVTDCLKKTLAYNRTVGKESRNFTKIFLIGERDLTKTFTTKEIRI